MARVAVAGFRSGLGPGLAPFRQHYELNYKFVQRTNPGLVLVKCLKLRL